MPNVCATKKYTGLAGDSASKQLEPHRNVGNKVFGLQVSELVLHFETCGRREKVFTAAKNRFRRSSQLQREDFTCRMRLTEAALLC